MQQHQQRNRQIERPDPDSPDSSTSGTSGGLLQQASQFAQVARQARDACERGERRNGLGVAIRSAGAAGDGPVSCAQAKLNVTWHWQLEAADDIRKIGVAILALMSFLRTAWLSLEAFHLPQNCGTVTVRMRLGRSPTVIHFTD